MIQLVTQQISVTNRLTSFHFLLKLFLNYSMPSRHYIYRTQVTKVNSVPTNEFVPDWPINDRLNLFVSETRVEYLNQEVLLAIMWLK